MSFENPGARPLETAEERERREALESAEAAMKATAEKEGVTPEELAERATQAARKRDERSGGPSMGIDRPKL